MTSDAPTLLLTATGIGKRYGSVVALKGVDFSANAGEVHALVGANGAGKSTLMNLVSGTQAPSEGEMRIDGELVRFADPLAAQQAGIATVYQEFSLVPQLSVARNVFLGREPKGTLGLVDTKALNERTAKLIEQYGFSVDPARIVATLSIAEQQIVEIVRALSLQARILILDEPTAVLSMAEQASLFAVIRHLKAQGLLILYVSHYLSEVLDIADRVTVLRDGEKIATREASSLDVETLAEMMIGHRPDTGQRRAPVPQNTPVTTFNITYCTNQAESRLSVHGGEILGVAGLVGAGRTTFARALSGVTSNGAKVHVEKDGQKLDISSPRRAMLAGVIYLTEDRKGDGLFAGLDIVANATAAALPSFAQGPLRRSRRETAAAQSILDDLRLVAGNLTDAVSSLSGGNQQKVLIGRSLLTKPKLLVCDEPTRGVDIGAKAEIYEILKTLTNEGVAILVVSSEIQELLTLSDRIAIMHERRFVAEVLPDDTNETEILITASGGQ